MPHSVPPGFDPQTAMNQLAAVWQSLAPANGNAPFDDALKSLQREWAARHAELWRALTAGHAAAPARPDRRFADPAWDESPLYRYLRDGYLINAEMMTRLADTLPVADAGKRRQLQFAVRQLVDAAAPTNFAATNPEFIKTALATEGESIRKGIENLLGDLAKGHISMTDESQFEVGRNLAATPGAVVFENELIQLIQYTATTKRVARRPFVIVPPCINKYYILDLQAENSFVAHLVAQGHTVFLVSWRNVNEGHGNLGWDDYLELGPLAALDVVREITGEPQANALGFCVGGTILSAALTVAHARGIEPVASLTLLTTLLDFADSGEIGCLVDEASVAMREQTIGDGGLLRGAELAGVFAALRANDLIWQYVVGNYLKGQTPPPFDLLYWNSDSTNLPGPFLAWYLRHLYLQNELCVPGKLAMCGEHADLGTLDMPAFIYASREDHIVPWMSAYASRDLLGGETTFVLGASGHIAGVINPPAKGKRSYWENPVAGGEAQAWLDGATEHKGSWWPRWYAWLDGFRGGERAARPLGTRSHPAGESAPGSYVREKA